MNEAAKGPKAFCSATVILTRTTEEATAARDPTRMLPPQRAAALVDFVRAQGLKDHGFDKSGLPPALGGSWSYDSFFKQLFDNGTTTTTEEEDAKLPAAVSAPSKSMEATASPSMNLLSEEIGQIPDSEKQAYLEAAQRGVYEDPEPFVKVCDGDKVQAARRLVDYWKNRKDIFRDRAFRPVLDLSGKGALTKQDVEALEMARPGLQLPNTPSGDAVICIDQSRQSSQPVDTKADMRCILYLLSRAATDASVSGIFLLRLVRQADFGRQSLHQLASLVDCFPAQIPYIHSCCLPPKGGSRSNFMETFVPVYEQLLAVTLGPRSVLHVAKKKAKLVGELLSCGFRKESLPTTVGGTWSNDNLAAWLHQKAPPQSAFSSNSHRKPAAASSVSHSSGSGLRSLADAAQQARIEDRKVRKRRMDSIYSRNRRQREKNEQKTLQQQCLKLTQANFKLEQENNRFGQMLADAKSKISLIEYGMSIAEQKQQSKKKQQQRKRKPAPSAATPHTFLPTELPAKKPKVHAAGLGMAGHHHASGDLVASCRVATSASEALPSGVSKILDLLNAIQSEQQTAELVRQRDELLSQVLAAKRVEEDRRVNDQQSLLQQVAETLSGLNPQQASAAALFRQKNDVQEQSNLPLQLQAMLGARAQQRQQPTVTPEEPQQQDVQHRASEAQKVLNQLLVANAAQSDGLSGLNGFAHSVASQPPSIRRTAASQQDNILQQILGASSSAYAQQPSSKQMQDSMVNFFWK